MHILLTDVLRCPSCGPEFGLILLADRMEERRILSGLLGCPNCRRSYPIEAGVADLRHSEAPPFRIVPLEISDVDESAYRIAALLGPRQANERVLLLGSHADIGARLATIFPEAHIVLGSAEPPAHAPAEAGLGGPSESGRHARAEPSDRMEPAGTLSPTLHGGRLPFATDTFAGVAVVGSPARSLLPEIARVLRPGARLVVEGAHSDVDPALRSLGFEVVLNQDATVVAALRSPR